MSCETGTGAHKPRYSDEQIATIVKMRAERASWHDIWEVVRKLPGARAKSSQAVENAWHRLKKKDLAAQAANTDPQVALPADIASVAAGNAPAAGAAFVDVSSQNSPPVSKEPEVLFDRGHVLVTYEVARAWAIKHGLCHKRGGLNLIAVNAARAARGLAKFQIEGAL